VSYHTDGGVLPVFPLHRYDLTVIVKGATSPKLFPVLGRSLGCTGLQPNLKKILLEEPNSSKQNQPASINAPLSSFVLWLAL